MDAQLWAPLLRCSAGSVGAVGSWGALTMPIHPPGRMERAWALSVARSPGGKHAGRVGWLVAREVGKGALSVGTTVE